MDDPVAYAVWHESEDAPGRIAYASPIKGLRGTGETRDGEEFIALYGRPSLTDAEREAVEWAVKFAGMSDCNGRRLATLRGLLERLG